jgi:hypothetical protein
MSETSSESELWDRQPDEPNRWFSRFERFRAAGPSRSLLGTMNSELSDKGAIPKAKVSGSWHRASIRWRWRERAEAWDAQERRRVQAARIQQIDEMRSRHIQEAQALQSKALQRLKSLELDDLSAPDVLRYFVEATKLERTARGEPDTIEERRVTGRDGGAVVFSLEDALTAEEELQEWQNDRLHSSRGETLPEGNSQVP